MVCTWKKIYPCFNYVLNEKESRSIKLKFSFGVHTATIIRSIITSTPFFRMYLALSFEKIFSH